jgi:hypothetical protein
MSDSELHVLKTADLSSQRTTRKRRLSLPPEMFPKKRKVLSMNEASDNPTMVPLEDPPRKKVKIELSCCFLILSNFLPNNHSKFQSE